MGYPIKGDEATQAFGYRFLTTYGTMEYKMLHMTPEEEVTFIHHLESCEQLEEAVYAAGANLDTNKAAVWERNPTEIRERRNLYRMRCKDLCDTLGIPPGPGLRGGSNREIIV